MPKCLKAKGAGTDETENEKRRAEPASSAAAFHADVLARMSVVGGGAARARSAARGGLGGFHLGKRQSVRYGGRRGAEQKPWGSAAGGRAGGRGDGLLPACERHCQFPGRSDGGKGKGSVQPQAD